MSKSCKECGHPLDDNAQECPLCGCPVEKESTSAVVDTDLLNEGKNTEAESTIRDYAELILKWGNILAIFNFLLVTIYCVINGVITININNGAEAVGIILIILAVGIGYLAYLGTKFLAKLIWAVIMLFVNISTTLKRIELKLEENGTH